MRNYCNIFPSDAPIDLGTHIYNLALEKIDCNPTCDYLMKDISDLWCFTQCKTDKNYATPIPEGKKLQLQFKEVDDYNLDPENPLTGWGDTVNSFLNIYLVSGHGAGCVEQIASAGVADVSSKYLVGWSGEFSYQLIELDMDAAFVKAGLDCISFKIEVRDRATNIVKTYYTEQFRKALPKENLVELSSKHDDSDCCGNYYGEPESYEGTESFTYNNAICIEAKFQKEVGSFTRETFGSKLNNVVTQSQSTLKLKPYIPCYINDYLMNVIFTGDTICVDGEEWSLDGQSPDGVRTGNMFAYDVSFYRDNDCKNGDC